jgi:hypothetical protein
MLDAPSEIAFRSVLALVLLLCVEILISLSQPIMPPRPRELAPWEFGSFSQAITGNSLVENPSFEYTGDGINSTSFGWTVPPSREFNAFIDSSTAWGGNRSFLVTSNATGGWSSIGSKPILVQGNKEFSLKTHLRTRNALQSHVAVSSEVNGTWPQVTQCPGGIDGDSPWREYVCTFVSPSGSSMIRIFLNSGGRWNTSKGPSFTWFDDIDLLEIRVAVQTGVDLTPSTWYGVSFLLVAGALALATYRFKLSPAVSIRAGIIALVVTMALVLATPVDYSNVAATLAFPFLLTGVLLWILDSWMTKRSSDRGSLHLARALRAIVFSKPRSFWNWIRSRRLKPKGP